MNIQKNPIAISIISLFFIICLMAFVAACSKNNNRKNDFSKQFTLIHNKANKQLTRNPAEAMQLMDSAFQAVGAEAISDTQMVDFILLKAGALVKLDRVDSAYSFMLGIKQELSSGKRDLVKIQIGLWLAQHLMEKGNYFMARKQLEETNLIFERDSFPHQRANALNIDGTLHVYLGDYVAAQKKLMEAAKILETSGETKALGPVYINLAINFQSLKDDKLALVYYRKALQIAKIYNDSLNYSVALNNLGIFYAPTHTDSAEFYFTKARNLFQQNPWSEESLSARFHLAGLFYDKKQYRKSLDLYNEVLQLSKQYNIEKGIYRAMSGIGNVYEAQNMDQEALKLFGEAAKLAEAAGETPLWISLLEAQEYMYNKAANYMAAYTVQKEIKTLHDSLFAIDKQIAVHDLELLYNNEKAERTNEALTAKMQLMKTQMRTNSIVLGIVLLALLVLGFLLFYIYKLYKQRDDAYNRLFEKYRGENDVKQSEIAKIEIENLLPDIKNNVTDSNYQLVIEYFETIKPYLNSNLKYDDVAIRLRLSHKVISKTLIEHTGMNFKTFVNSYRIKEALRLLAEPEWRNYKIEVIAKEAGFGSKANFYAAFIQITGSKPSEHR
jgi:AraC-like DNA-binding protein